MSTRIDAPFATSDETADILGVPAKRVAELRHIIEGAKVSRRKSGISWAPSATTLKEVQRRKSLKAEPSRRRKSRGKKTKRSR